VSLPERKALRPETAVQCVIEILTDSQEGLATVAERLEDQALKRYFFAESLVRGQFIDQLKMALLARGARAYRERWSAGATIQRTWARIKSRFMGGDRALLITAVQGEDAVTEAYFNALATYLPTSIREILTAQQVHVELAHAFMKMERDRSATRHATASSGAPLSGQI